MVNLLNNFENLFESSNFKVGIVYNHPKTVIRSKFENLDETSVLEEVEFVEKTLHELNLTYRLLPFRDDLAQFIREFKIDRPDIVINICESAFGLSRHEMDVASLLELLRIPYTGNPPLTLGICQDKSLTKHILKANGILTPEFQILDSYDQWKGQIDFPLFLKPLKEDSSIGISHKSYILNNVALESQINYLVKKFKQPVLVEKYVSGRELNVSILGNDKPIILEISEIIFEYDDEPKIVDYKAKWFRESEEYKKTKPKCPADLQQKTKFKIKEIAKKAYKALKCRDYGRIDIRLVEDIPFLLEVNPNPDISKDGGFVRSLNKSGISNKEFLKQIITFALDRKSNLGI